MVEPEHPGAGFTLVEVLVSLALLALLSLLILQATQVAGRMTERLAEDARDSAVLAVRDHVQRTVQAAAGGGAGGRIAPFSGLPSDLVLVTEAEHLVETGGQVRVQLGTEPTPAGLSLIETRALDRGLRAEAPMSETLLRGLAGLHLRYYGRRGPTPISTWGDDWPATDHLPVLVSIDIAFPTGDPRRWPRLLVPVAAAR